ncbi:uncharacterized protein LOC126174819 isoform X1 [Schistocerca cancellata]|uniref:uncharacterized protein LOC126174819 isoform X1 n=1 Tax=Schistocerca cancellata TaxID=274614 RepID=UPI0021189528|nr:uncharacterized protein LOC126174819 isoform X1 [Schistocerca cancellata]
MQCWEDKKRPADIRGMVVALFKRGWNEIPEVIGSSFMALIGFGLAGVGLYNYYSHDGNNRRYKELYTVYRSDDPRAARIRKD